MSAGAVGLRMHRWWNTEGCSLVIETINSEGDGFAGEKIREVCRGDLARWSILRGGKETRINPVAYRFWERGLMPAKMGLLHRWNFKSSRSRSFCEPALTSCSYVLFLRVSATVVAPSFFSPDSVPEMHTFSPSKRRGHSLPLRITLHYKSISLRATYVIGSTQLLTIPRSTLAGASLEQFRLFFLRHTFKPL